VSIDPLDGGERAEVEVAEDEEPDLVRQGRRRSPAGAAAGAERCSLPLARAEVGERRLRERPLAWHGDKRGWSGEREESVATGQVDDDVCGPKTPCRWFTPA
jgi:hypothetical protein